MNKRKQQQEILKSSRRQLADVVKDRRTIVKLLAEETHSIAIAESMIKQTEVMRTKIEEISKANIEYARTMDEDN